MLPTLPFPIPDWPGLVLMVVGLTACALVPAWRRRWWTWVVAVVLGQWAPLVGLGSWWLVWQWPTHGLAIGIALLLAWCWWRRRLLAAGHDERRLLIVALSGLLAGLLGARLWYVVEFWPLFAASATPVRDVFALHAGGLVFFGGVLAAALAMAWQARRQGLPFLPLADAAAAPACLALALGRLGCFANGCCYGGSCSLPWAVPGDRAWGLLADGQGGLAWVTVPGHVAFHEGVVRPALGLEAATVAWRHPTQLYEALVVLLIMAGLLLIRPLRAARPGSQIGTALGAYGCWRFLNEALRADNPGAFGGTWTASQWAALFVVVGLMAGLLLRYQQRRSVSAKGYADER